MSTADETIAFAVSVVGQAGATLCGANRPGGLADLVWVVAEGLRRLSFAQHPFQDPVGWDPSFVGFEPSPLPPGLGQAHTSAPGSWALSVQTEVGLCQAGQVCGGPDGVSPQCQHVVSAEAPEFEHRVRSCVEPDELWFECFDEFQGWDGLQQQGVSAQEVNPPWAVSTAIVRSSQAAGADWLAHPEQAEGVGQAGDLGGWPEVVNPQCKHVTAAEAPEGEHRVCVCFECFDNLQHGLTAHVTAAEAPEGEHRVCSRTNEPNEVCFDCFDNLQQGLTVQEVNPSSRVSAGPSSLAIAEGFLAAGDMAAARAVSRKWLTIVENLLPVIERQADLFSAAAIKLDLSTGEVPDGSFDVSRNVLTSSSGAAKTSQKQRRRKARKQNYDRSPSFEEPSLELSANPSAVLRCSDVVESEGQNGQPPQEGVAECEALNAHTIDSAFGQNVVGTEVIHGAQEVHSDVEGENNLGAEMAYVPQNPCPESGQDQTVARHWGKIRSDIERIFACLDSVEEFRAFRRKFVGIDFGNAPSEEVAEWLRSFRHQLDLKSQKPWS